MKPILKFFSKTDRHTGAPVEVPPVLKNKIISRRIINVQANKTKHRLGSGLT